MEKVVEVQQAVKNNAGDVQDYLRDLDNWTKQMEVKDQQLRQAKKKAKETIDTTKPREVSPPKKAKTDLAKRQEKKKEHDSSNSTTEQKIKSYDYAAWDKFDVEAACEEVEKEKEQGDTEEDTEEEELDQERRRVEAVAEKERGNAAFKAANWDKAIEKYTRGIQLDPTNCVLPANRAMALLKKGQFGAAETDCTLALSIDPTYVKAFHRRASARIGLKKFGEAVTDYDEVLRLEPNNKAVASERTKLIERIREGGEDKKEDKQKPFNAFEEQIKGALKQSDIETLKRDYNTMKEVTSKLKKAETKLSEAKQKDDKVNSTNKKQKSTSDDKNRNLVLPIHKPNHLRSQEPLRRVEIEDVEKANEVSMEVTETVTETGNSSASVEVGNVEIKTSKSKGFCATVEKEISADLSKVDLVESIPQVPKSSSKFLAEWRRLKTLVNRSKYLRQFKESDYVSIFKSSVDGSIFGDLVAVIHHLVTRGDNPEIVLRQVRGLSKLPRISAVAMFMSEQEKKWFTTVIAELECITGPEERQQWAKLFSL